jgi:hypothetical protein
MKAFISTLLASIAIAGPAIAAPLPADHQLFVDTMVKDGVEVLINEPAEACFDDSQRNGAYVVHRGTRVLVVCQDKRYEGQFNITGDASFVTEWTANDLDTIRHEGFHIIQDCMAGTKNDQEFDTVFTSQEDVIDTYGVVNTMRIMNSYVDAYGADRHADIKYEIEAFYAAENYSATQLNDMYNKYCM